MTHRPGHRRLEPNVNTTSISKLGLAVVIALSIVTVAVADSANEDKWGGEPANVLIDGGAYGNVVWQQHTDQLAATVASLQVEFNDAGDPPGSYLVMEVSGGKFEQKAVVK